MSDTPAIAHPCVQTVVWRSLPIEQVQPGVTRQVVHGDHQTVVRYSYEPGAVFPQHHHSQEQVTIVVTGQIEFSVAGQMHRLGPGELIIIPGDVPHGARVLGAELVETINTLSPRRDEQPGR